MPKLIQVIYTEERRGLGQSDDDPVRLVPQLWTLDGRLICEAENTYNDKMDGSGHFRDRAFFDVLRSLCG
jgi:hypothetical protein